MTSTIRSAPPKPSHRAVNVLAGVSATTVVTATVLLAVPQLSDELFGQPPMKNAKNPPGFVFVAVALIITAEAPCTTAALASITFCWWSANLPLLPLGGWVPGRL